MLITQKRWISILISMRLQFILAIRLIETFRQTKFTACTVPDGKYAIVTPTEMVVF